MSKDKASKEATEETPTAPKAKRFTFDEQVRATNRATEIAQEIVEQIAREFPDHPKMQRFTRNGVASLLKAEARG